MISFLSLRLCLARLVASEIKVRGLEAFALLCGGTKGASSTPDDLHGIIVDERKQDKKHSTNPVLDKYTIQEKLIPLMKAIKTKEPAVMVCRNPVL